SADRERRWKGVVGGLVEPYVEHQKKECREDHARCETAEARRAEFEVEQCPGHVQWTQEQEHEGRGDREKRERTDEVQPLPQHERSACREGEYQRRRRDRQFSRTTRSFTIRNPPASA